MHIHSFFTYKKVKQPRLHYTAQPNTSQLFSECLCVTIGYNFVYGSFHLATIRLLQRLSRLLVLCQDFSIMHLKEKI